MERSKFGAGTTEADDRSRTKQAGREAIEVVPAQGDVLTVAQLAGIMGAKQCAAVVPLCHNVFLSYVDVKLKLAEADHSVHVTAEVHTNGPTGLCPARTWAYCNAQRASSPGGGRGGGWGGHLHALPKTLIECWKRIILPGMGPAQAAGIGRNRPDWGAQCGAVWAVLCLWPADRSPCR